MKIEMWIIYSLLSGIIKKKRKLKIQRKYEIFLSSKSLYGINRILIKVNNIIMRFL